MIKPQKILLPQKTLKRRITSYLQNNIVDPFYLYLPIDKNKFNKFIKKIAKHKRKQELINLLRKKKNILHLKTSDSTNNSIKFKKIILDKHLLPLINLKMINDYQYTHHRVDVDAKSLYKDRYLYRKFLNQVSYYLSKKRKLNLKFLIKNHINLNLDQDILPSFAKKKIGSFSLYRGSNCFRTALDFQNQMFSRSIYFNIKKEKGHHKDMINYDELSKIIKTHFYEIYPLKTSLEFGDILLFLDSSKMLGSKEFTHMQYRSIRHATTYLFNGLTFSKGSKSANTTYTVNLLLQEWKKWRGYVQDKLIIKAFRRRFNRAIKRPGKQLVDWIY